MSIKPHIAWIPPSKNINSASFRLRVLEVMIGMRNLGYRCSFYNDCTNPDILIVSKKYDLETQMAMHDFRSKNQSGKIIFDLCDNHFHADTKGKLDLQAHDIRVRLLKDALSLADAVTTSSEYLAKVVADNCKIDPCAIFTVEDCYEIKRPLSTRGVLGFYAEIRYKWLEWRLNRTNDRTDRFVWFGTHGVSYAEGGMMDLLEKQAEISECFSGSNKSLTIISNSYRKYRKLSRSLNVRTYYLPWNQYTAHRAFRLHAYMLLPIKKTPFTLAKSANRPVAAMLENLLVICDMIPAYEQLSAQVMSPLDADSLKRALSMPEVDRDQHVEAARTYVSCEFSPARISERWESILIAVSR